MQLYVSVDAGTKESLKAIDRPLFGDFWERFIVCVFSQILDYFAETIWPYFFFSKQVVIRQYTKERWYISQITLM